MRIVPNREVVIASEAKRIHRLRMRSVSMDCWVASLVAMTWIHLRNLAARCARGLHEIIRLRKREGAGNAGCALHPRSRVQRCGKNAHEHTGTAGAARHSLRNGLTAYAALSPETNSSCHRRWRIEGLSNPVGLDAASASLTPATGARTTRFCRTQPFASCAGRLRAVFAHGRKARPANTTTRPTLPRPPQPAPTFVTMANAPLVGTGWREL